MSDRWREKLSEYIDGELSGAERAELEAHLSGCDECASTVKGLRAVVAAAAALEDRPPATDLWSGIAEQIVVESARSDRVIDIGRRRASRGRRRFSFSLPQVAAASIAIAVLSGGSAWLLSRSAAPVADPQARGAVRQVGALDVLPASYGDETFGVAIAGLQRALADNGDRLQPETVQTIAENLRAIDRAIGEARRALAEDPASDYLNDHLARTMQQKLEFLRETAVLVSAS